MDKKKRSIKVTTASINEYDHTASVELKTIQTEEISNHSGS